MASTCIEHLNDETHHEPNIMSNMYGDIFDI
jgi:hypothetical protein